MKVLPRSAGRDDEALSLSAIAAITWGIIAMSERRCQKVHCRSQAMLLPPCVDDYVSEHNTVRAIDAFVGTLDLQALGFDRTEATAAPVNLASPRSDAVHRCEPQSIAMTAQ